MERDSYANGWAVLPRTPSKSRRIAAGLLFTALIVVALVLLGKAWNPEESCPRHAGFQSDTVCGQPKLSTVN